VLAHRPGHLLSYLNSILSIGLTQEFCYIVSVTHHLVSVPEIAEMLGVSHQRVHQLIKSYDNFPEPEADLAIGRVWLRAAVQSWADSHPRTPGRRPSTANAPNSNSSENRHPPFSVKAGNVKRA
jgi:predicted DNA-binding transcriptional regulator AlpA